MRKKIPEALKLMVAERALFRCEYCHLPETQSFFSFQIEHIRSIKHNGNDDFANLAYACPTCNRNKGSDIGTWVGEPPALIRFFNPREDNWSKHFDIEPSGVIVPKTTIAEGTIEILQMNHPDAVIERYMLLLAGPFGVGKTLDSLIGIAAASQNLLQIFQHFMNIGKRVFLPNRPVVVLPMSSHQPFPVLNGYINFIF